MLIRLATLLTGHIKGFRDTPGNTLKNDADEVVYAPPQHVDEITRLMTNLEQFINDTDLCDYDPLVVMAIIHHQFESIHPFYDGNGRAGGAHPQYTLLDVVWRAGLTNSLPQPLYHRAQATLLRFASKVRDDGAWEEWLIFMLTGIAETAAMAITTIHKIRALMQVYKHTLVAKVPKLYSHELINTIFAHPYTKIEFVMQAEGVSRLTASRHLQQLVRLGLLDLQKQKTTHCYINTRLVNVLMQV